MSTAPLYPAHPPPLSAAEALSSLLWQPYDCRSSGSPPLLAHVCRSFTDDFLAGERERARGGSYCASAVPPPPAAPLLQSPIGGRHDRTRLARTRSLVRSSESEMRLAVPAPPAAAAAPAATKCAVTVRVAGEPSAHSCANVSSVRIVPEVDDSAERNDSVEQERTYASAECQTEEPSRRRRVRRARIGAAAALSPRVCVTGLPDLLDAHAPPPPPYSTLPHAPPAALIAGPPPPPPGAVLAAQAHRFPFQAIPIRRSGRSAAYACSESGGAVPKTCCGLSGARPPLRWCVLLVGVAGVCCVAAGAVLGALRPHPRPHLTLLLLMIGVGVVLVSVAGLAWRLSARDAPPCRALLGLRRGACGRRLVPRLPPSYARPHHPYAAMLYPEFQYRPPPPTYQASMQEYRLRLLLLDRSAPAMSPPPTYRSNNATLVRGSGLGGGWCGSEYSGPPSYIAPRAAAAPRPASPPSLAGVVLDNIGGDSFSIKYADDNHIVLPSNKREEKDDNLVTIVQTGEDVQPVIVTVSGSAAVADREHVHAASEIDILAHL